MTDTIEKYPPWKNAITEILKRFEAEGFGVIFSLGWLDEQFDIKPARTIPESQKNQFTRMSQLDGLTTSLRQEHQLCFSNVRGQGYQIMHPNDQVAQGSKKHLRKASREVSKAAAINQNVRMAHLDSEHIEIYMHNARRNSFLRKAFGKRKFPQVEGPKQKQIEDTSE